MSVWQLATSTDLPWRPYWYRYPKFVISGGFTFVARWPIQLYRDQWCLHFKWLFPERLCDIETAQSIVFRKAITIDNIFAAEQKCLRQLWTVDNYNYFPCCFFCGDKPENCRCTSASAEVNIVDCNNIFKVKIERTFWWMFCTFIVYWFLSAQKKCEGALLIGWWSSTCFQFLNMKFRNSNVP